VVGADAVQRPVQCPQDVKFQLTFCLL